MKQLMPLLALIFFALAGCDKSDQNKEFEAVYKGTFVRIEGTPSGDPVVAHVTLTFSKNTFTGSSDVINYPAICSGGFTINQANITATTGCFFTANFDWSLIFKGEYQYEQKGNQLRIWRSYPNGRQDIYDLIKEEQ
jgi:hypothetical protein